MVKHALGESADLPAVLRSFQAGDRLTFFFHPRSSEAIARYLEQAVPGWGERTLVDADRIAGHTVRLLGADSVDLDRFVAASERSPERCYLPWHQDVLNEYRWSPRAFHKLIEIPYDRADIKVPWELSRCQHLPTLAMAYLISGDERYSGEVMAQIDDWIRCNPPGYGVNWACAMDVAIRAVNWLWALHLLAGSAAFSDRFLTRLLGSLVAHGRHLSRSIERYEGGVTSNHTVADYTGLLYLGLLLPELRDAPAWTRQGRAGLIECMTSQVAPDGVDFENSISYHRLVLEMLAGSYLLSNRSGQPFPESFRASLERMFDFVYHYTRPDGLAPLVGDSDDGRLEILSNYFDWDPQDHRYLLAVGAAMFARSDFGSLARSASGAVEQTAWLLGPQAAESVQLHPPAGRQEVASRAFTDSGRYVMRHRTHYVLVSADEVGTGGLGNHKHNDIFSFELLIGGVPLVIDCGSYLYSSDTTWRNRFRSTRQHNTIMVDGHEQNEFAGLFGMRRDAEVRVTAWLSDSGRSLVDATHTGYERLDNPVRHRRITVFFDKDPVALVVIDCLLGSGDHKLEGFLHLAPGGELCSNAMASAHLEQAAKHLVEDVRKEVALEGVVEPCGRSSLAYARDGVRASIIPLNWTSVEALEDWVSPRFGRRMSAPAVRFDEVRTVPAIVGYVIVAS